MKKSKSYFITANMVSDILKKESPRAAAILACAYLENLIKDLIKLKLQEDKKIFKIFIDRLTFERGIMLGYLIGIISDYERDALDIMRKIRNHFAHDINFNDFNRNKIPSECDKLIHITEIVSNQISKNARQSLSLFDKMPKDKKISRDRHWLETPIILSYDEDTPEDKYRNAASFYIGIYTGKLFAYHYTMEMDGAEKFKGLISNIIRHPFRS